MFGSFGWPQLLILLVIILLLFGAKRLPEIGRSLGSGMREFKDGIKDDGHDTGSDHVITGGDDREHKG